MCSYVNTYNHCCQYTYNTTPKHPKSYNTSELDLLDFPKWPAMNFFHNNTLQWSFISHFGQYSAISSQKV